MLSYLADGYYSLKEYDKVEDTYKKYIGLNLDDPSGYLKFAEYCRKRNNLEKSLNILNKAKRNIKYIFNKDFKLLIDKRIKEYENLSNGIKKHFFRGYDSSPGSFVGTNYHPELGNKWKELKEKYKEPFEKHRKYLEKIDYYSEKIKIVEDLEENKKQFEKYCIYDINLYPYIINFYNEYNQIGYSEKLSFFDNYDDYKIFKKLISLYEKDKKFDEAIKICKVAFDYGIKEFSPKTSMADKQQKLISKREKST